ncbi:MAG: TetR/AcrR family transcriptional regulator [Candidatus Accumulibacter sp.]|nr:TetR/AcrR family transcriptional regulator [Accumulibacter sp.]
MKTNPADESKKKTDIRSGQQDSRTPAPLARSPAKTRRLTASERRAALLRAAKELSVELGVAGPSLDAIIKRAGGSRRSIYTEFGGKEGLRDALMAEVTAEILPSLTDDVNRSADLRGTLVHFARRLVNVLESERGVSIGRIIMQDNFASPARARSFFANGPGKGTALLAKILEAARERGEIESPDCLLAANCFIGMLRGNFYMERLFLLHEPSGEEEIEARIGTAVDIFLGGIEARGKNQRQPS